MLTTTTVLCPNCWERMHSLKLAEAHYSLQNSLLVVFILYGAGPCIHSSHVDLAVSVKHSLPFQESRDNTTSWSAQPWWSQLIHSTDKDIYLKHCPRSSPLCVEIESAFFATAVVSHTWHYYLIFMGTLPLSNSSIVEFSLSVTTLIILPTPWQNDIHVPESTHSYLMLHKIE